MGTTIPEGGQHGSVKYGFFGFGVGKKSGFTKNGDELTLKGTIKGSNGKSYTITITKNITTNGNGNIDELRKKMKTEMSAMGTKMADLAIAYRVGEKTKTITVEQTITAGKPEITSVTREHIAPTEELLKKRHPDKDENDLEKLLKAKEEKHKKEKSDSVYKTKSPEQLKEDLEKKLLDLKSTHPKFEEKRNRYLCRIAELENVLSNSTTSSSKIQIKESESFGTKIKHFFKKEIPERKSKSVTIDNKELENTSAIQAKFAELQSSLKDTETAAQEAKTAYESAQAASNSTKKATDEEIQKAKDVLEEAEKNVKIISEKENAAQVKANDVKNSPNLNETKEAEDALIKARDEADLKLKSLTNTNEEIRDLEEKKQAYEEANKKENELKKQLAALNAELEFRKLNKTSEPAETDQADD